jgi:hypothetical protein
MNFGFLASFQQYLPRKREQAMGCGTAMQTMHYYATTLHGLLCRYYEIL